MTAFILTANVYAHLLGPLARRLRQTRGLRSILVADTEHQLPHLKRLDFDPHDFAEIICIGDRIEPVSATDLRECEVAARAAKLELELGVSALDLLRGDRHLGIDFSTNVRFFRSSFGSRVNHLQALDIALRLCELSQELCLRYRPKVVIGYPGSIYSNTMLSVAEGMGVPMRGLAPPRRSNLFGWVVDRHSRPYEFQSTYEAELARLQGESAEPTSELVPTNERAQMAIDRFALDTTVKSLLREVRTKARTGLADLVRGRASRYGKYRLGSRLRSLLELWLWRRRTLRETALAPKMPDGLPFILFPLNIEPEASLSIGAPEADQQLIFVDWLAKTVPGGWRVVVKEHPVQGVMRPKRFWDVIRAYPNVSVAATLEPAQSLASRAQVVAVINGTLGYQAAAQGTPVITFHHAYLARVMPHVLFADSFVRTRRAFRRILEDALPPMGERLLAANAFFAALDRVCFPVTHPDMLAGIPTRTPMDPDEFETMVEHLLLTITQEAPGPGIPERIEHNAVL